MVFTDYFFIKRPHLYRLTPGFHHRALTQHTTCTIGVRLFLRTNSNRNVSLPFERQWPTSATELIVRWPPFFYATFQCGRYGVFKKIQKNSKKKKFFDPEKIWKRASKLLIIQPKSQFLFHKNLPPRDFSIMTLPQSMVHYPQCPQMDDFHAPWTYDNDVSRQEWPRVKNLIEWPESKWMTTH